MAKFNGYRPTKLGDFATKKVKKKTSPVKSKGLLG